jgi:hypothetical protein
LAGTQVGIRISVLQGSETGPAVYVETQTANTNGNGLLSIKIGTGTATTGTFAGINWASGPYFIKTETDPAGGSNYSITGTQEILSVPYAMYAKTVAEKTYTIGLWPELGGYVFRISADGRHGLVAETQNQSASCWWYEAQNAISNPGNHSTNGQKFMDWRLPTRYELNEMYLQKVAIGGFNDYYWSSTEGDNDRAYVQDFVNGLQGGLIKFDLYYVRAVRAF